MGVAEALGTREYVQNYGVCGLCDGFGPLDRGHINILGRSKPKTLAHHLAQ